MKIQKDKIKHEKHNFNLESINEILVSIKDNQLRILVVIELLNMYKLKEHIKNLVSQEFKKGIKSLPDDLQTGLLHEKIINTFKRENTKHSSGELKDDKSNVQVLLGRADISNETLDQAANLLITNKKNKDKNVWIILMADAT